MTPEELEAIEQYALQLAARQNLTSLESVFGAWLGHVGAQMSPLQTAICRIFDGEPLGELADHPHVTLALGGGKPPEGMPARVQLLAGIRTGKSLLAAAIAWCCTQRVDMAKLGPGEVPRVSVVSLQVDLAKVIYQHLVGNIRATEAMAPLLLGEPTSDSVLIQHPSGKAVEVKVVAGSRAGATLVARWSAGCIFDESPRMVGADAGAVVNLDDMIDAVMGRLLPGAQLVDIGSPWAPFGPAYETQKEHWGKPTRALVVIRSRADHLNPYFWTQERVADIKKRNEKVYRTDVLGEFADVESSLFTTATLEKVARKEPLTIGAKDRHHYVAVMDPATRANAWTLVVGTQAERQNEDGSVEKFLQVVMARQWQGSVAHPLDPEDVLIQIGKVLRPYRVKRVISDQYAADALKALGRRHGLAIDEQTVTSRSKVENFSSLATLVDTGQIELPDDRHVMGDLKRVRRVVTQVGIRVDLPQTADGRHCDYAASLAMLAVQPLRAIAPEAEGLPDGWTARNMRELADSKRQFERENDNGRKRKWRTVGRVRKSRFSD